jgi:hypothetical protein
LELQSLIPPPNRLAFHPTISSNTNWPHHAEIIAITAPPTIIASNNNCKQNYRDKFYLFSAGGQNPSQLTTGLDHLFTDGTTKLEHIFVEGQLPDGGHQANQSTAGGETSTASIFVGGESAFGTHPDQVSKLRTTKVEMINFVNKALFVIRCCIIRCMGRRRLCPNLCYHGIRDAHHIPLQTPKKFACGEQKKEKIAGFSEKFLLRAKNCQTPQPVLVGGMEVLGGIYPHTPTPVSGYSVPPVPLGAPLCTILYLLHYSL